MLRTIQKLFYLHYLANDSCVDSFWLESYLQHCGPELGMVWEFSVFFIFISDLFVDIVTKKYLCIESCSQFCCLTSNTLFLNPLYDEMLNSGDINNCDFD